MLLAVTLPSFRAEFGPAIAGADGVEESQDFGAAPEIPRLRNSSFHSKLLRSE